MVKKTFGYDACGFLEKDTCLCFEGVERDVIRSTIIHTYVCDQFGNCLEKKEYVNGKLTDVVLRSYEYFV